MRVVAVLAPQRRHLVLKGGGGVLCVLYIMVEAVLAPKCANRWKTHNKEAFWPLSRLERRLSHVRGSGCRVVACLTSGMRESDTPLERNSTAEGGDDAGRLSCWPGGAVSTL
jgi:hypothetical protein